MKKPTIKTPEQIKHMEEGGKMLHDILYTVVEKVAPGISTQELNLYAEDLCKKRNITPSFKGYGGFPGAMCVSVNEEVVHGIPLDEKILKEGDIITLDFGVFHMGLHTDSATTVPVGKIDEATKKLLDVTKEALQIGLNEVRESAFTGTIGSVIQKYVEKNGFSVVRECVGHGIGASLHEPPEVPNFGRPGEGVELKENMTIAVEPIVNVGSYEVKTKKDNWTVVTADKKRSAHFEHTIVVKKDTFKIIT